MQQINNKKHSIETSNMSAGKKIEERVKNVENAMELLNERIAKLEEKLGAVDHLCRRVDDVDSKHVIYETTALDKFKDMSEEIESKFTACEIRIEDKLLAIGNRLEELVNRTAAFELGLAEMTKEWPTPKEVWTQVESRKNERRMSRGGNEDTIKKPSFGEKFKNKAKDTIVLVGDSLARGVGAKLEQQSHMVTTLCKGGAKIEQVAEEISRLDDKEDRHLVVLVGTNNIQREGSIVLIDKYRKLLEECKKIKNRKVSLIGIPRRSDLSSYEESRRIGVNLWLKELCNEYGAAFLPYEPRDNRLARDGLHLNHVGQDELGRAIFVHCKSFLG